MALSAEVSMTAQAVPSTDRIAPASAMSQTSKKSTGTVKSKKSVSKGRSKSPGKAASAKSKPSRSRSKSSKKGGPIGLEGAVDILSPVAMENLSYIAHEAQGALTLRGFPWKGGPKKKKGKGGKKKKK